MLPVPLDSNETMRASSVDEIKSQGYLVYSEWGPDRRTPRDMRLATRFPETTQEERAAWIKEFDSIDKAIWQFAESGGPRLGSLHQFKNFMLPEFPFLNEEALLRAWTLCGYYTFHEGY
jgi:hypothetical protein